MEDQNKKADQISQDINKSEKDLQSTGGNQVKPAMGNTDSGDHRDVEADKQKKGTDNTADDKRAGESDKEYISDREFPEDTPGSQGKRSGSESNAQ